MKVRIERVSLVAAMTLATLLAVAAFEVWFFLYAGSPLDSRSGR